MERRGFAVLTDAVGSRAGPRAVGGAVTCSEAGGLVALPAGVRHGAGKQHAVAEDDLGVGRRSRVSTGYSWRDNQRGKT